MTTTIWAVEVALIRKTVDQDDARHVFASKDQSHCHDCASEAEARRLYGVLETVAQQKQTEPT